MSTEGGKANAILSRQKSLEKYYKDPSYCLECCNIIHVQDGQKATEVRRKRFCNRKCSTSYNNRISPKRKKVEKPIKSLTNRKTNNRKTNNCKDCNEPIKRSGIYCLSCWRNRGIFNKTKKEFFDSRKNWQSAASSIRKHSRLVFEKSNKPKVCGICGYDNHVQISHIKSVSDFKDDAKISEINDINNLVALCPNHHWEFDHGLVSKDRL